MTTLDKYFLLQQNIFDHVGWESNYFFIEDSRKHYWMRKGNTLHFQESAFNWSAIENDEDETMYSNQIVEFLKGEDFSLVFVTCDIGGLEDYFMALDNNKEIK